MTVDLAPLMQALVATAAAVITVGGVYLTTLLNARIKNAAVRTEADRAISAVQGTMYSAMVDLTRDGKISFEAAKEAVVQGGVKAFTDLASDAAIALVKPENVQALLAGALGNALTIDPGVTVQMPVASAAAPTIPQPATVSDYQPKGS